MTSSTTDPLLGVGLPGDDPAGVRRLAAELQVSADRVDVVTRRLAALVPTHRWSGVASVAADERVGGVLAGLVAGRVRLLRAASALERFAAAVARARADADEARGLVTAARRTQQEADLRDARHATDRLAGWGGHRADGGLDDVTAVGLLDRARRHAYAAQSAYDAAAARLVDELSALSGRRVVRARLSPRLLLDVAGLVPVVGDAVDAANAVVYAAQGRWGDAALTAAAVVPGPPGWAVAGAKVGKGVERAGEVAKVVDDVPAEVRVADTLAGLTRRGIRKENRVLDTGAEVEELYRTAFAPLGPTRLVHGRWGDVLVTELPQGGRVSFRWESQTGGATIQFDDVPGVDIGKIHVARG